MKNINLLDKRFIVVTGKGGVGKSAVSAALAIAISSRGRRVLLASMHRGIKTCGFFGAGAQPGELFPVKENLWAVNVTPQSSMREYGLMILRFERLYRRVFEDKLIKYVLEAIPSLEELVMFGKTWFHAQEKWKDGSWRFDTVIMDSQATGHAMSMLSLPGTIVKAAPLGQLKSKAEEMLSLMTDPEAASLCIVTTPEEMPINESLSIWKTNNEIIKMPEGMLFINRVIEPLFKDEELRDGSFHASPLIETALKCARLRISASSNQAIYLARAENEIPMKSVILPEIFSEQFGEKEAGKIAGTILQHCKE